MKKKIWFICNLLLNSLLCGYSRYIHHMTIFVQEELVNNTEFSHTLKSDKGKVEEKFMVNHIVVNKEEYYRELDNAQLADIRKERERVERQKRTRMHFIDQAQVAILEKMIVHTIELIQHNLIALQHEQLKKYYFFDEQSINSMDQFLYIKHYIEQKAQAELKNLLESCDMLGLQELFDRIESWPEQLEILFKNSVDNAIKHSDDTVALKELLALISS